MEYRISENTVHMIMWCAFLSVTSRTFTCMSDWPFFTSLFTCQLTTLHNSFRQHVSAQ